MSTGWIIFWIVVIIIILLLIANKNKVKRIMPMYYYNRRLAPSFSDNYSSTTHDEPPSISISLNDDWRY